MSMKSLNIMPSREAAAAAGRTEIAVSTPASMPIVRVGGPVNATLLRWQAQREARTYRAMAESTRAQTEFVNTRADLARSFLATAQAISELRELPVILEHDAQMRQALRDRDLATVQREAAEARYGLDATRDEIGDLRAKQRKKIAAKEQSALRALTKAKVELEALGRDTAEIDQALARVEGK
ncbi:MAG: hypothetical protein QOF19_3369 [Alphaproteobacteria bacterium]|jgi:hypothetical protein|nr:hypothetical protein [Alphaproteobacteria bacterium]